jgi:copper chaperone NosL
MKISDGKFGAELVTDKGRIYKFDDLDCLLQYSKSNGDKIFAFTMVHDFSRDNELIDATTASYIISDELNSPMRGNIAAFSQESDASEEAQKRGTKVISWSIVKSKYD